MLDAKLTVQQRHSLVRTLAAGLQCSEYALARGGHGPYYINLDWVLADPRRAKNLCTVVVSALREHILDKDITKLVFIDTGELGPRGMLQMRTQLSTELEIGTVLCQPSKRVVRARLVGDLGPQDRVAIIADVITWGDNVAEACAICRAAGATVALVYTVFDRQEASDIEAQFARLGSQEFLAAMEFGELKENYLGDLGDDRKRDGIRSHVPAQEKRDLLNDALATLYS